MKRFVFLCCFVVIPLIFSNVYADDAVSRGQTKSAVCAACHGNDGNNPTVGVPVMAGQHADYLLEQMIAFKAGESGSRNNPIMTPLMQSLTQSDMEDLAKYYAAQKTAIGQADPKAVDLGERLYRGGDLSRRIPACSACHGPQGLGNASARFPRLSGQRPDYIIAQLKLYQTGARKTGPASMMSTIAGALTETEMNALAQVATGLH